MVHQTGTTTLVPRPKLSIASSDREFYISSADWKSYLASYALLCTSQANLYTRKSVKRTIKVVRAKRLASAWQLKMSGSFSRELNQY